MYIPSIPPFKPPETQLSIGKDNFITMKNSRKAQEMSFWFPVPPSSRLTVMKEQPWLVKLTNLFETTSKKLGKQLVALTTPSLGPSLSPPAWSCYECLVTDHLRQTCPEQNRTAPKKQDGSSLLSILSPLGVSPCTFCFLSHPTNPFPSNSPYTSCPRPLSLSPLFLCAGHSFSHTARNQTRFPLCWPSVVLCLYLLSLVHLLLFSI